MSSDAGNLQQGARGGARALQDRCTRRIHGEAAGACRYYPISTAGPQANQREKSDPENCDEGVEGEVTFAEAVGEGVVGGSPAHPPSPPVGQTCLAAVKDLESPARTIQNKTPTIHDSEGPSGGCGSPLVDTGPAMAFDSTPGSASISPTQGPDGEDIGAWVVRNVARKRPKMMATTSFKGLRPSQEAPEQLKTESDTDHGDSTESA